MGQYYLYEVKYVEKFERKRARRNSNSSQHFYNIIISENPQKYTVKGRKKSRLLSNPKKRSSVHPQDTKGIMRNIQMILTTDIPIELTFLEIKKNNKLRLQINPKTNSILISLFEWNDARREFINNNQNIDDVSVNKIIESIIIEECENERFHTFSNE